jgi:hypothetical protein
MSEGERMPETCVYLSHQPVRQGADALLKDTSIDGGDLCDIYDRIGFEPGNVGWHCHVTRERRESWVARKHRHSDSTQIGTVVLVGADKQHRS